MNALTQLLYNPVTVPARMFESGTSINNSSKLSPVYVQECRNLLRLFNSIIDHANNRFLLSALPKGIVITSSLDNTVNITYNERQYQVTLQEDNNIIIEPMELLQ